MKKQLLISLKALLSFTILCCVLYPLFIWGIGLLLCPHTSHGSLVKNSKGQLVGSLLIAQNFSSAVYFHPRPSHAGKNGFDATQSSGSNLGPTSNELIKILAQRVQTYRKINHLQDTDKIPNDAVLASASGLDPHISLENALCQAPRIALARDLPLNEIQNLIKEYQEMPFLGFFGQAKVNVLKLNLTLDHKK